MGTEQVSVERLVERAWEDFEMRLISIGALYVLWGAVTTADELTERFCVAKGTRHLLDRRRRLNEQDEERLADIQGRSELVIRYLKWARQSDGQPILRDAVVAYCSAFENALKTVAAAFQFASFPNAQRSQFYLKEPKFKEVLNQVAGSWEKHRKHGPRGSGESTAKAFFNDEILPKNPKVRLWQLNDPASDAGEIHNMAPKQFWGIVADAFKLRNAIIHLNGRLTEQVLIGKEVFQPGEVHLTTITLKTIERAFRGILDPFNPEQF